jgi:hypothetical protein
VRNGRPASGNLRVLPSGRVQVRYTAPDGIRRTAPMTFATKVLARRWLTATEADMARGVYRHDRAESETVASYGERWIAQRDCPFGRGSSTRG